jgi:hypothetical protein
MWTRESAIGSDSKPGQALDLFIDGGWDVRHIHRMSTTTRLSLVVTQTLHDELKAIADESGSTMSEVFRIAFALCKVCYEAKRKGQHVGVVNDVTKLDREIIGIL